MIRLNGKPLSETISRYPHTQTQREASRQSAAKINQARKDRAALRENLRMARAREAQLHHSSKPIMEGF